jgi:phosphate transport system permease protein
MLAAVPSVVIGLWGIFVLGPFLRAHIEPFLGHYFGWIPLFSGPAQQATVLAAIIVLTIMIIPITSSICRELFVSVPRDVKEASLGLGATRWEMVRGVVVPYVRGGVAAITSGSAGPRRGDRGHPGDREQSPAVHGRLLGGNTLASQLAELPERADEHRGRLSGLPGLILLVITFITNLIALIVHRFDLQRRARNERDAHISLEAPGARGRLRKIRGAA